MLITVQLKVAVLLLKCTRLNKIDALSGKSFFVDEDFDRPPMLNLLTCTQVAKMIHKSGGKVIKNSVLSLSDDL